MIWQNIKMALLSIRSAKLRSFLTMLGIIIGVSSVLIMIAIGDGVKQEVTGQISNLGSNLLTIVSGKIGGSGGSGGFTGAASGLGASTLTKQDVDSVSKLEHVEQVSKMNLISSLVVANGKTDSGGIVVSTDPDLASLRALKFEAGGFFTARQNDNKDKVAVLGGVVKKNLFGNEEAVGKTVKLRNSDFTVVGVVQSNPDANALGSNSFDNAVYLPFKTGEKLTGSGQIFRILTKVNSADKIDSTKKEMEAVLKKNHADQEDFSVLSQQDLVKTFSSVLDLLTSFVVAIASISLLVGGIGIMNIMLVSVSERTREIGIRKAVGASFGNILSQFLVEAVVISIIGGAIGLGLAYVLGQIVKRAANITPVFSLRAVLIATGISILVGIVFGVAPAIKAAKKRPIQALKSL